VPNKNVRDFCGTPMIGHVLRTARESGLFDVIHVSTDSEAVRDIVTALGHAPDFPRPPELADDHTPLMPVLRFVVDVYGARGRRFDEVWLLMACAPLLEPDDLRGAAELFRGNAIPLLSVAEYPSPVEWAFSRDAAGILRPVQPGMFAVRSQDLGKKYFDAGVFAAYRSDAITSSTGAGSDAGFMGYVLPRDRAVDIDDEADWKLAERMYRARQVAP
jgi:N-acylneuraminate cytidylyltransferase